MSMLAAASTSLIFDEAYPLRGNAFLELPVPVAISGGGAAPTQFDVWLSDGSWAYVRYRSGVLTVDFGTTEWIAGADGKTIIDYEPHFAGEGADYMRRQECSWREVGPFLLHALAISAGRRLSSEGYVVLNCPRL
jgi:hypothetical protein